MNTQGLLDQLLKSASGALSGSSSTNKSQSTGGGSQLGSLLSGAGGGALAAGAGRRPRLRAARRGHELQHHRHRRGYPGWKSTNWEGG